MGTLKYQYASGWGTLVSVRLTFVFSPQYGVLWLRFPRATPGRERAVMVCNTTLPHAHQHTHLPLPLCHPPRTGVGRRCRGGRGRRGSGVPGSFVSTPSNSRRPGSTGPDFLPGADLCEEASLAALYSEKPCLVTGRSLGLGQAKRFQSTCLYAIVLLFLDGILVRRCLKDRVSTCA